MTKMISLKLVTGTAKTNKTIKNTGDSLTALHGFNHFVIAVETEWKT